MNHHKNYHKNLKIHLVEGYKVFDSRPLIHENLDLQYLVNDQHSDPSISLWKTYQMDDGCNTGHYMGFGFLRILNDKTIPSFDQKGIEGNFYSSQLLTLKNTKQYPITKSQYGFIYILDYYH